MENKFIKKSLYQKKYCLLFLVLFFITGCTSYAKENVPYAIKAEFLVGESTSDYENCGIDLLFLNKADLSVEEFTVVFYLFDSYGEPISTGKSNIVLKIVKNIGSKETLSCCISLDDYMNEFVEEEYSVDYLYISKIVYIDGSVWEDPFGMKVF